MQGRMDGQTDGWVDRGLALLPQTARGKCPCSPTSGHIPRAGGGCPGRSPFRAQEQGLAASTAAAPCPVLGPSTFVGRELGAGRAPSSGRTVAARPSSGRRRDAEPCSCPYMSRDKAVLQQAGKTRKSGHKAALCPALCLKGAMALPRVARKRRAAGPVPLGTGTPHGHPSSITHSRVGREGARGMLRRSLRFLGWGPSLGRGLRRGGRDLLSTRRPQPWEPRSPSRSGLPGRSGWFGGAAGLGWLPGGPDPPAWPHCGSPGAARVPVRGDVGTRSLGWGRSGPPGGIRASSVGTKSRGQLCSCSGGGLSWFREGLGPSCGTHSPVPLYWGPWGRGKRAGRVVEADPDAGRAGRGCWHRSPHSWEGAWSRNPHSPPFALSHLLRLCVPM